MKKYLKFIVEFTMGFIAVLFMCGAIVGLFIKRKKNKEVR